MLSNVNVDDLSAAAFRFPDMVKRFGFACGNAVVVKPLPFMVTICIPLFPLTITFRNNLNEHFKSSAAGALATIDALTTEQLFWLSAGSVTISTAPPIDMRYGTISKPGTSQPFAAVAKLIDAKSVAKRAALIPGPPFLPYRAIRAP